MFSLFTRRLAPTYTRQLRSLSTNPAAETPNPVDGEQQIHDKLKARFSPEELLVQDVSGGCGQFYTITIASTEFKGLSTIKQHRLVNDALKEEIPGIHGLQLKTIVPK